MINNTYLYTVKQILIKIKEFPLYFTLLIASSTMSGLSTVISILLLDNALNITFLGFKAIQICIVFSFALCFIEIIQNLMMNRLLPVYKEKMIFYLYKETYKVIGYSKSSDYDNNIFLDNVFFSLSYGIQSIQDLIGIIASFSGYIVSLICVIKIIITYDYDILFILLVGILGITFVGMRMKKLHREATIEKMPYKRREDYVRRMFTLKEHNNEIQLFDASDFLIDKLSISNKEKTKVIQKYGKSGFCWANISSFISYMYQLCILVNLLYKNLRGMINVAGIAVAYYATKKLETQLFNVIDIVPTCYEKLMFAERYFDFYEDRKKFGNDTGEILDRINKITLEDVDFSYGNKMIINKVNLSIEGYGKYVIVGKNGVGKSTLLKLINGIYQPQNGRVKLNDIDLLKINNAWRKDHMSMVLQEYTLFSASILENVAIKPKEKADLLQIEHALQIVGLDQKIKRLQMGIDTIVSKEFSEEGAVLSQGEKQRLIIARAYATGADVLLLDEPLSNVDEASSELIMNAISQLSTEKIIIYISHNDKYIRMSDWIIEINDNGNVEKYANQKMHSEDD